MDIYVVDTSVSTKWFSSEGEEYVQQAQELLRLLSAGRLKVFIPDLAIYELGNVLLKSKKRPAQETDETLIEFLSFPLTIVPFSEKLLKESTHIAQEYSLTFYDSTFLALAKIYSATLITENLKDQQKVKEVKVLSIADFSPSKNV